MTFTFAVNGCTHGELDLIYNTIGDAEIEKGIHTDFLVSCGDFQATRNMEDLQDMACPDKYKKLKDFPDYFIGKKKPYCLTLFIGGNHEAIDYLKDLYFGGYVSNDIFYLGYSSIYNIIKIDNNVNSDITDDMILCISGISGIYKLLDYEKGHYEKKPYDENTKRSCYHVRQYEIEKLSNINSFVDIMVSHDWPGNITNYGDIEKLLKVDKTGMLKKDIDSKTLGNPHTQDLLEKIQPYFWFSGHMHMHFTALVPHKSGQITRFQAIDKCGYKRLFLQWLTYDSNKKKLTKEAVYREETSPLHRPLVKICYNLEWLAILKKNNHIPLNIGKAVYPQIETPTKAEIDQVRDLLALSSLVRISHDLFQVPSFTQQTISPRSFLCKLLQIKDPFSNHQPDQADDLFFEDNFH